MVSGKSFSRSTFLRIVGAHGGLVLCALSSRRERQWIIIQGTVFAIHPAVGADVIRCGGGPLSCPGPALLPGGCAADTVCDRAASRCHNNPCSPSFLSVHCERACRHILRTTPTTSPVTGPEPAPASSGVGGVECHRALCRLNLVVPTPSATSSYMTRDGRLVEVCR